MRRCLAAPKFCAAVLTAAIFVLDIPSPAASALADGPGIIVRLVPSEIPSASGTIERFTAQQTISAMAGVMSVETLSDRAGIVKLNLAKSTNASAILSGISKMENVASAELDTIIRSSSSYPNDPLYDSSGLYGIHKINAPDVWAKNIKGSKDVVVCVIDSGVDYTHPDLAGNMWINPGEAGDKANNGIDDDGNGYVDDVYGVDTRSYGSGDPMDDYGSGTRVAGIIGGVGNNGIGLIGVSPTVSIMACKFLGADGSGFTSHIIKCLEYALDKGAAITSNSWGSSIGGYSSMLHYMMDTVQAAGQLFVTQAGNSAANLDDLDPSTPAGLPHDVVITVASSTSSDEMSSGSNYGPASVDLGAPGSNILSTVPNGGYELDSGTGRAAPYVSGAIALLLSAYPSTTASRMKEVILFTGKKISDLSDKTVSGRRLDVQAALNCLEKSCDPCRDKNGNIKGKKDKDCAWVGGNTKRRCAKKRNRNHCQETCGLCPAPACEDDPDFLLRKQQGKDCQWIADTNQKKHCRKKVVKKKCPATCGQCPTFGAP